MMSIYLEKFTPSARQISNCYKLSNLHKKDEMVRIGILNLMPNKLETELQFLNIFSRLPFDISLYFIRLEKYVPKNCSADYLGNHYIGYSQIQNAGLDGLIITGAPVELKQFEEVDYWEELTCVMEIAKKHIKSTIYICWAALAGLYYHYGIEKQNVEKKVFGVFKHNVKDPEHELFKGFDDEFFAPHSRHSEIREEDIEEKHSLEILSTSDEAGVFMVSDKACNNIFITGHLEYDAETLKKEYERDLNLGKPIQIPEGYFDNNNPNTTPKMKWKSYCTLFYTNWIFEYLKRART
jgi:homoserine O-succinyltransferase